MGSQGSDRIDDLPDSRLGTLEYWEQVYKTEVENLKSHGEEGEIWFGTATERRVTRWIQKSLNPNDTCVVDLGCGNGHFCLSMAEIGFENIFGLDYSLSAIELARSLAIGKGITTVRYQVGDILNPDTLTDLQADLIVDKGTFDAISLMHFPCLPPEYSSKTHFLGSQYTKGLSKLGKPSHTFIITSCNWTESELISIFKEHYSPIDRIQHPSYSFGGSSGSTVSTVVFKSK